MSDSWGTAFREDPAMEQLALMSEKGEELTAAQRISLGYYLDAKKRTAKEPEGGDAK